MQALRLKNTTRADLCDDGRWPSGRAARSKTFQAMTCRNDGNKEMIISPSTPITARSHAGQRFVGTHRVQRLDVVFPVVHGRTAKTARCKAVERSIRLTGRGVRLGADAG
jgi:hypothetical protein